MTNSSRMGQTGKQTLIEDDTEFKGVLSSKCPIVVKGAIEGEIAGPSLQVSATGSVSGQVKVGELRSEGVIAGQFDADVVQLAGTVKNDTVIRARTLEVRLQPANGRMQVTFGECELAVGDVPSKEDAVAGSNASANGTETSATAPPAAGKGKPAGDAADKDTDVRAAGSDGEDSSAGGRGGRARRNSSSPASA